MQISCIDCHYDSLKIQDIYLVYTFSSWYSSSQVRKTKVMNKCLSHLELIIYLNIAYFYCLAMLYKGIWSKLSINIFHVVIFLGFYLRLFILSLILSKIDILVTFPLVFIIDTWYIRSLLLFEKSFNGILYYIQMEYPSGLDGWGHVKIPAALSLLKSCFMTLLELSISKYILSFNWFCFPTSGFDSQNIW